MKFYFFEKFNYSIIWNEWNCWEGVEWLSLCVLDTNGVGVPVLFIFLYFCIIMFCIACYCYCYDLILQMRQSLKSTLHLAQDWVKRVFKSQHFYNWEHGSIILTLYKLYLQKFRTMIKKYHFLYLTLHKHLDI